MTLPSHLTRAPLYVTDGGMETTLIFHRGLELPSFASFTLLRDADGRDTLRSYFDPYLAIARDHGVGIILDTPTWRANPDWGEVLGYSSEELAQANRDAVALVEDIRHENPDVPTVLAGVVGPRGDGYRPDRLMTADEAARYHTPQIATLGGNGVDLIGGITLTYAAEAVGIARGARAAGVPSVISFTVETDGRLPDGQPLRDAVEQVDVETERAPLYFMVNCAHPTHFANVLEEDGEWLGRIRGVRANASTRSHAELDEAEDLDDGDPAQLGEEYRELDERLPDLLVVGGCCGTDERHIGAICRALG